MFLMFLDAPILANTAHCTWVLRLQRGELFLPLRTVADNRKRHSFKNCNWPKLRQAPAASAMWEQYEVKETFKKPCTPWLTRCQSFGMRKKAGKEDIPSQLLLHTGLPGASVRKHRTSLPALSPSLPNHWVSSVVHLAHSGPQPPV